MKVQAMQVLRVQLNEQQALQLTIDEAAALVEALSEQLRAVGVDIHVLGRPAEAQKAPRKKAQRKK